MKMKRITKIIKRCLASFFSLTSISMLVWGIVTLQLMIIVSSIVWFCLGGLLTQSVIDIERVLEYHD